jgi:hypothetical protein
VFFAGRVSARDARRLGTAIISHTCSRTRQLKLESYDRLFPNQDSMPKGGFGNLIALPLQKIPRENGCSVFVDAELRPFQDQWAFLASIQPMAPHDIEPNILRATGRAHPLDVTFIDEEDLATPWKRSAPSTRKLLATMPKSLTVTLSNLIYFEKAQLRAWLRAAQFALAATFMAGPGATISATAAPPARIEPVTEVESVESTGYVNVFASTTVTGAATLYPAGTAPAIFTMAPLVKP